MLQSIARILLGAILSDTLNLQSVTTTQADKLMVTFLAIMGDVQDHDDLARRMFRAKTEWIVNSGAYEMVRGDQKDFSCDGWTFGIAVLEVTDPSPVLEVAQDLLFELQALKVEKGMDGDKHNRRKELDFSLLFVVDVTRQESFLLVTGSSELALAKVAFPHGCLCEAKGGIVVPDDTIAAEETLMKVGNLVSRKAQFVPAVLHALSNGFKCHKKPVACLDESELLDEGAQAITSAVARMNGSSYHDSVRTYRDYTGLKSALTVQALASNDRPKAVVALSKL
jgi:inorganic pyrophosphatase/exopolyphosphatase